MSTVTAKFFQVSGTLTEDAPSYIERPADEELISALEQHELCLVLAPRQTGKSSLMVHAAARLEKIGVRAATVDLQSLGNESNPDKWFRDVIDLIEHSLQLEMDTTNWWKNNEDLGPTRRFSNYLEEVILNEIGDQLAIFFDEIDSVLKLPFSDDFFTTIRSLFNASASNANLRRLNFVLLGTASAASLIKDSTRTPFNVGKLINLDDFNEQSIHSFHQVLGPNSDHLIKRIFYWTNGQPWMVQNLAKAVSSWSLDERSEKRIDEEVMNSYFRQTIDQDTHLKFIQRYLLANPDDTRETLLTYRKILERVDVPEKKWSSIQNRLKLAGIVRAKEGKLIPRNRIYQTIFDLKWTKEHTPINFSILRYGATTIALSALIVLSQLPIIGGLLWAFFSSTNTATTPSKGRTAVLIVLALIYEVALLAVAFGRKAWKENLEKDAVRIMADWMRGVVLASALGFRRRYCKQVISDHGVFNVRGLGLINTYALSLEQIFVNPRIDPIGNSQRFNVNPIVRKELAGNRPVWDFLRLVSSVQNATALAIIGPPGCGKTTLLQHIAVTLALNQQRRHKVRAYTPVLLFLRDHAKVITGVQPPSLGHLVQDYFGDTQLFPMLRMPPGWFERELMRGRCIVLLDGLDEVSDTGARRAISTWVDSQIANYPLCPFVLTARPQGYADAPLQRAHVLEMQPFSASQVRHFIENWYLANEIVASGNREDKSVRVRARKDAEDLLRRLQTLPSLAALTVNPLLLTMSAMVHRYHGALPGSRVELYAEICEVLLGRWRQSRGVQDTLKTAQKLVVLRPLAAHMMERKIRDITTEEAASVVAGPLKLVGVTDDDAPKKFLSDLQAGSGLLLEREAGQWSFAHLTFQEYLTAAHWLEQKGMQRDWRMLVSDSWWHETLRLYAAQGDATPLVRACLEVDSVTTLALAADFLEEARQLLHEVRRDAEQRLVADFESDDSARRRLAAEVRLTRRLRNLQRIDDEREIDLDFITYAEYQFFLDNMSTRGDYSQLDHWTKLDALKPVAGIQAEDAIAFCAWLTQRQGGNIRYRLPQPNEAQQYPGRTLNLSTWCLPREKDEFFAQRGIRIVREHIS